MRRYAPVPAAKRNRCPSSRARSPAPSAVAGVSTPPGSPGPCGAAESARIAEERADAAAGERVAGGPGHVGLAGGASLLIAGGAEVVGVGEQAARGAVGLRSGDQPRR